MEQDGKIKFWIQRINRWICYTGMFLILPLMLFTTSDVIGWAVWARPITGIVELYSYVMDLFIFIHEGGLQTVPIILISGLSFFIPRPKSTKI